jgi:hypothetical protein
MVISSSVVRQEISSLHQLGTMNISRSLRAGLRQAAITLSAANGGAGSAQSLNNIVRIDISKGGKNVVTFFNNLEKDHVYKRWPKKLKTLLMPSWQLTAVARNLYTVVTVVDPLTFSGAYLLQQLQMIWQQQYPVRVGVVPYCGSGDDKRSANARLCRMFAHVRDTYGISESSAFLFQVAMTVMQTEQQKEMTGDRSTFEETYSIDVLTDTYVSALLAIESIYDSRSKLLSDAKSLQEGDSKNGAIAYRYEDYISNTTAYLAARGLPVNSFSMNGIVVKDTELSQYLMQLLGREQFILSQAVRAGTITDKTSSIFNAVLELNGDKSYTRYHSILEPTAESEYVDLTTSSGQELLSQLAFRNIVDGPSSPKNLNSTVIIVGVSENGYKSSLAATKWADSSSAVNRHRLAIVPVLNPAEEHCISDLITDLATASKMTTVSDSCINLSSWHVLEKIISVLFALDSMHGAETTTTQLSNDSTNADSVSFITLVGRSGNEQVLHILESLRPLNGAIKKMGLHSGNSLSTVVLYNARRIEIDAGDILYEQDLQLFANLEYARLGSALENALSSSENEAVSDDVSESSNKYVALSSFVGTYGGKQGMTRADVAAGLVEIGVQPVKAGTTKKSTKASKRLAGGEFTSGIPGTLGEGGTYTLRVPAAIDGPNSDELSVTFILDPLSVAGQRAVSLMKLFRDSLCFHQTVVLTPRRELSEFPLQNFYRFVVPSSSSQQVVATKDHSSVDTSRAAHFRSLPKQHTLTVRVDGPEPWNIQALAATQDIDNLVCKSTTDLCGDITTAGVQTDVTTVSYVLKNILFTGTCVQHMYGQPHHVPPNGLQLTFTRLSFGESQNQVEGAGYALRTTETSGTLVMQNLGYYQLQANPGLWNLNLAKGRAQYLYDLDPLNAAVAADSPSESTISQGKQIAVKSFSDVFYRLNVYKRSGRENVPLLQDSESSSNDEDESGGGYGDVMNGIWESVTSMFGTGSTAEPSTAIASPQKNNATTSGQEEEEIVHVFSLATGHMYERLLRIMMLSVTKRTSVKVKFWLLENYLSPTFKQIVQLMSDTYKFDVGYVTYKWPEWLRQQTQKQRIIWGYKILFLDVLFPLDVKKVIYVDADQVLRADLKELWDLDLQGKPYAYTPFCTSREETLGFQFWRSGYWAEHLRGNLTWHGDLQIYKISLMCRQALSHLCALRSRSAEI